MTTLRCRLLTPLSATEVSWIPDAVVEFDRTIVHVGPYTGQPIDEDIRPAVLTPGFVDSHLHFPQTRIVGAASGPLLEWLQRSTFPEETRFSDLDHAQTVAQIFCRKLLESGTTLSMIYSSVHPGAAAALFEALDHTGLRPSRDRS